MIKHLPIVGLWVLLISGLLLVGTATLPAVLETMSEKVFRFLQILGAAGAAFLGFYGGTRYKYEADRRLAQEREARERVTLAIELLAEIENFEFEIAHRELTIKMWEEGEGMPRQISGSRIVMLLRLPEPVVLKASIGRLGILGPEAATCIVGIVGTLDSIASTFDFLGVEATAPTTTVFPQWKDTLKEIRKTWDDDAEEAIRLLREISGAKSKFRAPTEHSASPVKEDGVA